MKKVRYVLILLVSITLVLPLYAHAESFINVNGIEITDEDYDNFSKLYPYEYIMTLTKEKYEKLKTLDYSDVKTETKYIESTYNSHLGITTEKEITEEEFELMPMIDSSSASGESSAKRIAMAITGGTWGHAALAVTWKQIPKTRSFDVIGFRGFGFEVREGSQTGDQIYITNGEYKMIDYGWNGTNIKKFDNGFGISMNIVNDDISVLQLVIDCDLKDTITHPTLNGSYQHAISSVTLEQSKNYVLNGAGLGGVFEFPYSITEKYDGMSGLIINY